MIDLVLAALIAAKTIEVAGNDVVNEVTQAPITHQEMNRVVEIIKSKDAKFLDIAEAKSIVKKDETLLESQQADALKVLSDLMNTRAFMDEQIFYNNYICYWKIRENPQDLDAEDSPFRHPEWYIFDIESQKIFKKTQPWSRVVMAVCGTPIEK